MGDVVASIVNNPPANTDVSAGGRLERGAAQILEYQQYLANQIIVGGQRVDISTPLTVALGAAQPVDNTGTPTGGAILADTTYFAYVAGPGAPVPNALVLSVSAPIFGLGTLSLNNAGTGSMCRYVGAIRTDAAVAINDSDTRRDVCNHYNRVRRRLFKCAGYVDDNLNTTVIYAAAAWGLYQAAAQVSYVSNGDDVSELSFVIDLGANGGAASYVGLGFDTVTDPLWVVRFAAAAIDEAASLRGVALNANRGGFSTWSGLANSPGAVNITFVADLIRNGRTADQFATYLIGSCMV